ncbi:unnamed protein product [Acanthoscelides obtectus]|uniref:Uncharacterized protein n=1 Tax=Acanthoscelides obtectus TaxID=200917 RepID=A0A9P0K485_ACAOB|nr:unnamed protein product [Acanthoscelides obtectus]CAK1629672.1 Gustatory receptor for sugar taste 64f [Acanthoscelides obtectus]
MITGESLKFRLRQITHKIMLVVQVKVMDKTTWYTLRKDYLLFSAMHMKVNDQLAAMIVSTFCINLYFVLLQMFNTLRNMEHAFLKSYSMISFFLLLSRIAAVIIFGSGVNEEWRKIRGLLDSVTHWAYNIEVERFIETVESKELFLTGMNFFSIKRGLILHIAGAIVTYELVLMQFYEDVLKTRT